jgi:predicted transposase YbfD/YdcC
MLTKTPCIFTIFSALSDPRQQAKVDHSLTDMIAIVLCSTLCGVDHWADTERFARTKEDWFRRFLKLENGIPSHDTFGRVFALLDTEEFYQCLQKWIESLQLSMKDQGVHIDGKTLRRSFDSSNETAPLQIVSAWASGLRLCLGQVAVDEDSNEISAVPKLLELLELTGAVVTLEAMHCQKKTARQIRNKNADYILTVKGNQPSLQGTIGNLFERHAEDGYRDRRVRIHKTTERSRGRVEQRVYTVVPAPRELRENGWTDIKTVGMLYRHREVNGKETDEVVYFISSLPPKVRRIAKHLRNHWTVENQLHWSLDVTFAEDASRIRKGSGQEVASMFRRLALSMLKRNTTVKASLRGKRLMAGWDSNLLEEILSGK